MRTESELSRKSNKTKLLVTTPSQLRQSGEERGGERL